MSSFARCPTCSLPCCLCAGWAGCLSAGQAGCPAALPVPCCALPEQARLAARLPVRRPAALGQGLLPCPTACLHQLVDAVCLPACCLLQEDREAPEEARAVASAQGRHRGGPRHERASRPSVQRCVWPSVVMYRTQFLCGF